LAGSAAVARRPWATPLALARTVPIWAWLGCLVAVSTTARYLLARGIAAPWIMVDELIYSELAKSFAAGGHFLVRDQATAAYGLVYPALISPAWAFFSSVPTAYAAAKAINALLMSLTAVPTYFLARRVVGAWSSLAAAALAVAVPSMVYSGTLMTENAFYPIFACAALAMVLWLEQPTLRRTLVTLALFAVAYLTRAQAVAILPALLTAPFLVAGRKALREFRYLFGLVGGAAIGVIVVQAARGRSPLGVLGAYEAAGHSHYHVTKVAKYFLYHVAELDLSLGVFPLAALILLGLVLHRLDRKTRVFVAAALTLTFWLVLEVAAFASANIELLRVEERNMFYASPLLLIALFVWIERGVPRPIAAAGVAALAAAALPGVLPYSTLINLNSVSDTPTILAIWALQPSPFSLGTIPAAVVTASALAGLLFLLTPRRYVLVLPALVLVFFAVAAKPIEGKHRYAALNSLAAGINNRHLDWIDRAAGSDSSVSAVWSGNAERYTIWENEIFNRSVGTIYDLGPRFSGGLAETATTVDPKNGVLLAAGKPVRAAYALTDGSVELGGRIIARDARKGMLLYRVDGFLRQLSRVDGLYPQDTWSGAAPVRYTRHDCRGGHVAVLLQSDPSLFTAPQTVTAFVGGHGVAQVRVSPTEPRELTVPLRPAAGSCIATFSVRPTAIPAQVTKGQNPDTRVLGIHFSRFTYTAPA
jgi:4-amino-4-deoxy-L-arabinose transferase-like glycosyltransferase